VLVAVLLVMSLLRPDSLRCRTLVEVRHALSMIR
jgi:hypothetical protein